jgi:hypothetical protein
MPPEYHSQFGCLWPSCAETERHLIQRNYLDMTHRPALFEERTEADSDRLVQVRYGDGGVVAGLAEYERRRAHAFIRSLNRRWEILVQASVRYTTI